MIKTVLTFFKTIFTYILVRLAFDKVKEEKGAKCALPSCNVYTTHRGGYCCAEHKLLHKEMHKGHGVVNNGMLRS